MQASSLGNDTTMDARTLGTLATRLTDALGRAQAALAPHAAQLPGNVLADLAARLAELERRRIRIAIYGEVKAGKSTLLNAIAGAPLSPVAFDPLTSIPVRVTYGEDTTWRIGTHRLDNIDALERLMRDGGHDANEVVIETDLELLQLGGQVDLLDTPGVGSVAALDAVTADALRSLDAVVLVVRYPALFTEYTRQLMDELQKDIGKLFVVWNLDAACTDLSADERARHAETLRTNVAGAHELLLVDARAGFRAMTAGDGSGAVASGLSGLITALRAFTSSGDRDITALREAAKRTQRQLSDAQRALTERQAALEQTLAKARARLQTAQTAADAKSAAERARFAEFETAITRIGEEQESAATKIATDLRRRLRTARRRWAHRGDFDALAAAIAAATSQYADAIESVTGNAHAAAQTETKHFGAPSTSSPRARIEPTVGDLAPEAQRERAGNGRWQWLRRGLWHRWYLPGLAALERTGIGADLAARAAWGQTIAQAARDAAQATLTARLGDIARRAEAEQGAIKAETNFVANQAEFDQLSQHLPIVAAQAQAIEVISNDARALLRGGATTVSHNTVTYSVRPE